jgi:hypothetical protein
MGAIARAPSAPYPMACGASNVSLYRMKQSRKTPKAVGEKRPGKPPRKSVKRQRPEIKRGAYLDERVPERYAG